MLGLLQMEGFGVKPVPDPQTGVSPKKEIVLTLPLASLIITIKTLIEEIMLELKTAAFGGNRTVWKS